ncbi:hypothetical protein [Stygiolobus sp. RP850M]|uniref:hypothetical protein n=1 Tax=Stygiolobus sp. RP850M TaxID=3133137 RepID=UPI003FD20D7B
MGIATLLYGFYEYLQDEKRIKENKFEVKLTPMWIYTGLLTLLAVALVVSLYISAHP